MPKHASSNAAPAGDGNIAIREEYEAAIVLDTVAAYDLFIARHPYHELAAKARQRRDVLLRNVDQDGAPDGEER
ncbi:hypothetical protein [Oricola cellulosilytica]|uniref:Uncharacterized protein n=1 Tax=Oricola cellulosilytica TaxID=1429082 RepID=A0A4R0P3V0_9HYPH|nr:hypothetical protein [Oricola cellulosilytica]TCD11309.1 hypothetical protein E0D97_17455 [Oricola cellulosilytica]